MLGIPCSTVLVKTFLFLRNPILHAFPRTGKQRNVILRLHSFREHRPLATHALGEPHCPRRHIGFRVDMDVQRSGGLPQVKEDDRLLRAHHAVEPHGSLYPAILPELLQAGLRVRGISRKARTFLQLEVGKPDPPGAVGNGGDHRHAHDAHILFLVDHFRKPNKLSHPASTSVPRDAPPTPLPPSAEIVPDATLDDLDEVAIAKARKMFKKVHNRIPVEEVNKWTDEEFLSKCELMVNGKLRRAAIILLGKMFSDSKLRPAVAEVTWTLRDSKQEVVDYEHFSVPFILTVDEILAKIHNLTLREMPGGTLFPDTMKQYDDYTIREALHNCIAHEDYTLQQRINLVENPGFLYYANGGTFIPGTLENALETQGPQRFFRNACLCKAMVHFNMIDTVSRGIKKMFTNQMERRFPMPDYEIDNEKKEVAVRIYGNAINERYTKLLKENDSLTLHDCISLDAIQKGHRIDEEIAQDLLKRGLIEGEAPNYTISIGVAKASKQLPGYTKAKGLEKEKLKQMVLQLLKHAGIEGAMRDVVYDYLKDVLPVHKTREQQLRFVGRLLVEMDNESLISRDGLKWKLRSDSTENISHPTE